MPEDTSKVTRSRRDKLESFKGDTSVGPLYRGLRDVDELLIASFYNRRTCQRFRNDLSASGISSSTKADRLKIAVFVRNVDRMRAFELLDKHRQAHPDNRPEGVRRDYDARILCTLAGIGAGISFLGTSQKGVFHFLGFVGSIVSGLCMGSLLDRCRRNHYYYGQLQFSMAEIMSFTAVAAALIAFWNFVLQL